MSEDREITLSPYEARLAKSVAKILWVIKRISKSQAEIHNRISVFISRVVDEFISLGEKPDSILDLVIVINHILLEKVKQGLKKSEGGEQY